MIKHIKKHIFTIPQKIELLILYGTLMFLLGIASNYYYSNKSDFAVEKKQNLSSLEKVVLETTDNKEIKKELFLLNQNLLRKEKKLNKLKPEPEYSLSNIVASKHNNLLNKERLQRTKTIKSNLAENQNNISQTIFVKKGDNFTKIMEKMGLGSKEIFTLGSKIDEVLPLRNLKVGQKIQVFFIENNNNLFLKEIIIDFPLFIVHARKNNQNEKIDNKSFTATLTQKKLTKKLVYKSGIIQENLYVFAKKNNVPFEIIPSLIDIFSFDIDFQRDITKGTSVEILFEELTDSTGHFITFGKILYTSIKINNKLLKIYHFKYSNSLEYFKPDGSSIKRTLLKTPIDGAIISSHFGKRKHPILGYTKTHKGIDFAAKKGTPVFAAGDGKIIKIGRNGGYGNYIRIRHNVEYDSAYAHLDRFAKNLKKSKNVKQGQIIAYVGSTGASTGPHLHFEILKHNIQVNPLKIKTDKEKKLRGKDLIRFHAELNKINTILADFLQSN